jgi:predicted enzyme related to lactoylglutathione lyase
MLKRAFLLTSVALVLTGCIGIPLRMAKRMNKQSSATQETAAKSTTAPPAQDVVQSGGEGSVLGQGHSVMVRVDRIEVHRSRAVQHGAHIVRDLADFPYGERQYTCCDLAGHHWTFSQTIANIDPADWGGKSMSSRSVYLE